MKYTIQILKDVEFDVDFQKIHDLIRDEYIDNGWAPEELDNDWGRIGEEFGDNVEYYLNQIDITNFDYDAMIEDEYDHTCDSISDDFYDWLEEKYDKK